MWTCYRDKANCTWSLAKQAKVERTLSVSSMYFEENAFSICFNTASFDASVNKEPKFYSSRMRHLFSSPCLVRCLLKCGCGFKHIISKGSILIWSSRSPAVTVPDFFLWKYLKSIVYTTKLCNLDELKDQIRTKMSQIPNSMLENVYCD